MISFATCFVTAGAAAGILPASLELPGPVEVWKQKYRVEVSSRGDNSNRDGLNVQ